MRRQPCEESGRRKRIKKESGGAIYGKALLRVRATKQSSKAKPPNKACKAKQGRAEH